MFPLTPKTVERRFYNQGSYLMIMLLILLNSDVEQQGFWFKWLPLASLKQTIKQFYKLF